MVSTGKLITLAERKQGALLGIFVGDALAMPVHWYYKLDELKRDYGQLTGYTAPHDIMEGSYLCQSNTGGGSGGSFDGDIIGTVINHGLKKWWVRDTKYHYHVGLKAGENTLEAQIARQVIRTLARDGGVFKPENFLKDFVTFMTTPGSHNDPWASTCHRTFFANYAAGVPAEKCAQQDKFNTDTMDSMTQVVPIIVATVTEEGPSEAVRAAARSVIPLTRQDSASYYRYVDIYADLLATVLSGKLGLKEAVLEAAAKLEFDVQASVDAAWIAAGDVDRSTYLGGDGSDPMVSCPIEKSFPALLHFAYRYADFGVRVALLASANGGGENVARNSALGPLFGAALGIQGFPESLRALHYRAEIEKEIGSLVGEIASKTTEDL